MRIVYLQKPFAPGADGFYEVGTQKIGKGPFTGEGARVRLIALLSGGVAVWRHDPAELLGAETEEQLIELVAEAEAAGGPRDEGPGTLARLVARIAGAPISPPPHGDAPGFKV